MALRKTRENIIYLRLYLRGLCFVGFGTAPGSWATYINDTIDIKQTDPTQLYENISATNGFLSLDVTRNCKFKVIDNLFETFQEKIAVSCYVTENVLFVINNLPIREYCDRIAMFVGKAFFIIKKSLQLKSLNWNLYFDTA